MSGLDVSDSQIDFMEAIFDLDRGRAHRLLPRVDWTAFSSDVSPLQALFDSVKWRFWAKALDAQKTPADLHKSEWSKNFALEVMGWCAENGRTDLVREPFTMYRVDPSSPFQITERTALSMKHPIYCCVMKNFGQGVLFCLQQGGDPHAHVEGWHSSALKTAEDCKFDGISRLIASFEAGTVARHALTEIGLATSFPEYSLGSRP